MRVGRIALTGLAAVALTILATAAAVTSARAATFAGTVRDADGGVPLAGVRVRAVAPENGTTISTDETDEAGFYELPGLPAGTYLLAFSGSAAAPFVVTQYYDRAPSRSRATPLEMTYNQIRRIDALAIRGGILSGTVSVEGGGGAAAIDLDLYDSSGAKSPHGEVTKDDGSFRIGPVLSGTYYLFADPSFAAGQHLQARYFGGATKRSEAKPIAVVAGRETAGRNIALPEGYYLLGSVEAPAGRPRAGIDLDVFDARTDAPIDTRGDVTRDDGHFVIGAVPPGVYKLKADNTYPGHLVQMFFASALSAGDATAIDARARDALDLLIRTEVGGYIEGSVRSSSGAPLAGIDLDLFDAAGDRITEYDDTSAASGLYRLGPVPPGTYYLSADPAFPVPYCGLRFGATAAHPDGTALLVRPNQDESPLDLLLEPCRYISGHIRRAAGGAAVAGVRVRALLVSGADERTVATARSDADGAFHLGGLPAGTYRVLADPDAEMNLVDAYYPHGLRLEDAAPISLTLKSDRAGIDFALQDGASIRGRISGGANAGPLAGIDVDVYWPDEKVYSIEASPSDAAGAYEVRGLPAGRWLVRADPPPSSGLAPQFFPFSFRVGDASPVRVSTAAVVSGIDFALRPAGTIHGRVTDEATQAPLAGLDVDVWDDRWQLVFDIGDGSSDADGRFVATGLEPGEYFIRANPDAGDPRGYMDAFYDGAGGTVPQRQLAGPVVVEAPADGEEIPFPLRPGAAIAGTIRRPDSHAGVPGVPLRLYDATGLQIWATVRSRDGGSYRWGGLPPGQYRLGAGRTMLPGGDLLEETFYEQSADLVGATPIAVFGTATTTPVDISMTLYAVHWTGSSGAAAAVVALSILVARRPKSNLPETTHLNSPRTRGEAGGGG
ncbi:MAG: carboxypeptidase regulatory-like domain-containing protein [Candidatus Schekmanbacteria bacterium]|nr:carboxypeptidase regulatory-like domain-containing protein [Candidatus Schekmanbacteria bacterium]